LSEREGAGPCPGGRSPNATGSRSINQPGNRSGDAPEPPTGGSGPSNVLYSTPPLFRLANSPVSMPSQFSSTSAVSPPSAGDGFSRTVLPSIRTGQVAIL